MPTLRHSLALGSLLLMGSAILDQAHAEGDKPKAALGNPVPAGLGGATGNARVMALVAPGGAVVRSKGVVQVTNPGAGIYCVKPTSSSVKVGTLIPTVSVDFTATAFTDAIVQYRNGGLDCPPGTIEVVTLARNVGQPYSFSS